MKPQEQKYREAVGRGIKSHLARHVAKGVNTLHSLKFKLGIRQADDAYDKVLLAALQK